MQTKFWIRRAVLAIVWGLGVSTWASIGHHLMGLPDVGLLLVIGAMALVLARPAGHTRSVAQTTNRAETALQASPPAA
jgi:hypothetical protein